MSSFLKNDFYTIATKEQLSETQALYTLRLNVDHPLFEGHFPQMPVVPGVCQTQMIKELLEEQLNVDLLLSRGDNIKFTGMILPSQHPQVMAELSYRQEAGNTHCEARLFFESTVFTKFKGTFTTTNP